MNTPPLRYASRHVATQRNSNGDIPAAIENVVIRGDLSKLSEVERTDYYFAVCKSVGLNPLTKPMEYITLNGKLTLYALRNCTDQLRAIHKISVADMAETERDGVYIVTCKVSNAEGRTDISKGAVNIEKLRGEALANALMKAETKAKRRATLSICGLSLLDETEIEDIPAAAKRPNPHVTTAEDLRELPVQEGEADIIPRGDPDIRVLSKKDARPIYENLQKEMRAFVNPVSFLKWANDIKNDVERLPEDWRAILSDQCRAHLDSLRRQATPDHDPETGEVHQDKVPDDLGPPDFIHYARKPDERT